VNKPYRVLVTGSRNWPTPAVVWAALNDARDEALLSGRHLVVVHGACPRGADDHAAHWCQIAGQFVTGVTEESHRAEDFGPWPACGPFRNKHMVSLGADVCFAFIGACTRPRCYRTDPHPSHGASHCARLAEQAGIPVRRWVA
jgi:hypothetical protein